ncbi:MAG: lipoyl synthase [bacterium]
MNKIIKPSWLKVKFHSGPLFEKVSGTLRKLNLNTVCDSAACPNKGECWGLLGTATFMIMGNICTRNCLFCKVNNGTPFPLDKDEPFHIAEAVYLLKLRYTVLTSVTRDDLPDGGAEHFARTVKEIKKKNPNAKVEVLVPDFKGSTESINKVAEFNPDVFSHNIETVENLTKKLRSSARYERSLNILSYAGSIGKHWRVKSSIIIGLGETMKDINKVLNDLLKTGVSIVHIGQYLQPSKTNVPVIKYYTPEEFEDIKKCAENLGFSSVLSGPLVRSSYHAEISSS